MIEMTKALDWFAQQIGKHTYSMTPPRFDCSYSVAAALKAAGATISDPNNYSTVNLGGLLKSLGFEKVYAGPTKGATMAAMYDVVLMTNAADMSGSGGAGGHTGIIGSAGQFFNTTATDWLTGLTFQPGKAVQTPQWLDYIKVTRLQNYTEIWRLKGANTPPPSNLQGIYSPSPKLDVDGWLGVATWHMMESLAGITPDSVMSGQNKADKARLKGVTVPIEWSGRGSLTITKWQKWLGVKQTGLLDAATVKALQTKMKAMGVNPGAVDGVISGPSTMVKGLQTAINNGWIKL